jgi:hypothetical protein
VREAAHRITVMYAPPRCVALHVPAWCSRDAHCWANLRQTLYEAVHKDKIPRECVFVETGSADRSEAALGQGLEHLRGVFHKVRRVTSGRRPRALSLSLSRSLSFSLSLARSLLRSLSPSLARSLSPCIHICRYLAAQASAWA